MSPERMESLHAEGIEFLPLEDLLATSDILVNCLPLDESTRNLLDAKMLALLQPTCLFVNVGRAGTLDERRLLSMLDDGLVAGAGFDVCDPATREHSHPRLLCTPHIGSNTAEAQAQIAMAAAEIILQRVRLTNPG